MIEGCQIRAALKFVKRDTSGDAFDRNRLILQYLFAERPYTCVAPSRTVKIHFSVTEYRVI